MKKGIINEEIKRIHEIMGISPINLLTEGDILRLLGISAEEAFEKVSKSEGEAIAKEFEELTTKVSLEPAEAVLVSSVLRKLFPSSVEKYITNLRNQFTQPGVIETYQQLFKNPKATNELISNTIKKAGVDMTPEGVQIWRDVAKDAPIEIKPTKSSVHGAPVAKTNDIIINTGTMSTNMGANAAIGAAAKDLDRFIGASASSQLDNLLSDFDAQNLNVTPQQYDAVIAKYKAAIAERKALHYDRMTGFKEKEAGINVVSAQQKVVQQDAEFWAKLDADVSMMETNRNAFFENQKQVVEGRKLKNRATSQDIDITGKRANQELDFDKDMHDIDKKKRGGEANAATAEASVKTAKARKEWIKVIGTTALGIGIASFVFAIFFINKNKAQKVHETLKNGLDNSGTIIMGSDSTQQKQEIQPEPKPKKDINDY
jgi:hypothetical protein